MMRRHRAEDCQPSRTAALYPQPRRWLVHSKRRLEGKAMIEQITAPRSLSRRRLIVLTGVALGAGGLLAACQSAAPAASPAAPPTAAGVAPSKAAPVTTGASALKGTKLTIIGGNSYVPAQDAQVDSLIKQLSADTGMAPRPKPFSDAPISAKGAAVYRGHPSPPPHHPTPHPPHDPNPP